jgi:hypothetical protein
MHRMGVEMDRKALFRFLIILPHPIYVFAFWLSCLGAERARSASDALQRGSEEYGSAVDGYEEELASVILGSWDIDFSSN